MADGIPASGGAASQYRPFRRQTSARLQAALASASARVQETKVQVTEVRDTKAPSPHFSPLDDSSSDEEIPKLSALTKALLKDGGHASDASSTTPPPVTRRFSPVAPSPETVARRSAIPAPSSSSAARAQEARADVRQANQAPAPSAPSSYFLSSRAQESRADRAGRDIAPSVLTSRVQESRADGAQQASHATSYYLMSRAQESRAQESRVDRADRDIAPSVPTSRVQESRADGAQQSNHGTTYYLTSRAQESRTALANREFASSVPSTRAQESRAESAQHIGRATASSATSRAQESRADGVQTGHATTYYLRSRAQESRAQESRADRADHDVPSMPTSRAQESRAGASHQSSSDSSPARSRENSPAPRRRVRFSNAADVVSTAPAADTAVNTPMYPVRTVRIPVASSGSQPRSGGSSGASSRRSAEELPEDAAASRRPVAVATQNSARIRRVGATPGSFLSGPARRGRRRQSEEDVDAQAEENALGSGQEPERQAQRPSPAVEEKASSPLASNHHDHAATGSPVSARESARAALRRRIRSALEPPDYEDAHLKLVYQAQTQPAADGPSDQDKENEAATALPGAQPAPSGIHQASQPGDAEAAPNQQPVEARSDRDALAPIADNAADRSAPPSPPKMSMADTATAAAGSSTAAQPNKKKQYLIKVNGKTYTKIDTVGRGGTSRVYRVAAENGKILALKRVPLGQAHESVLENFKGEIELLKRLSGVDRVIQLIDHELNSSKMMLSVVMEIGDVDFHTFLRIRENTSDGWRFDPVFVRHYWKEMLECVNAVHAKDIVHSDLKPANFVLVRGRLKLIDFGIADAIDTDVTVNVHRTTNLGTPNYMSPESLMDSKQYAFMSAHNGKWLHVDRSKRLMKIGKPSDVWSLGCILYQLVYGQPPFAKFHQDIRPSYIVDWSYKIEFPKVTMCGTTVPPSLIRTMQKCLDRDQTERPTCSRLLSPADPFLYPRELEPLVFNSLLDGTAVPMTEDLLANVINHVVDRCRKGLPSEAEVRACWGPAYWSGVKQMIAAEKGGAGGRNLQL